MSLAVCQILANPGSRRILVTPPYKKKITEIRLVGFVFFYVDRQT
jgi:hypothetical protein